MQYLTKSEARLAGKRINQRYVFPELSSAFLSILLNSPVDLLVLGYEMVRRLVACFFPTVGEWKCRRCETDVDVYASRCPICRIPFRSNLNNESDDHNLGDATLAE